MVNTTYSKQIGHMYRMHYRHLLFFTSITIVLTLSYSDVACGVTLNTIIWHHKRDSGYDLEVVKNMCVHEYLEYIRTHPKPLARHPTPQLTISEKTKNELIHYVEYANAIYGVTL